MQQIDFYYDFVSPYSYLAVTQLPDFAKRNLVDIHWIPVNLPSLITRSGNIPPSTIPQKAMYLLRDLKRWSDYLDVPLKMIMPGSFDARPALNIASSLEAVDRVRFSRVVFDMLWRGEVSTKEEGWLQQVFQKGNLPDAWLNLKGEKTSPALEAQTESALNAGAFGAPIFILHGKGRPQLFWGIDRLDFLERAVQAR